MTHGLCQWGAGRFHCHVSGIYTRTVQNSFPAAWKERVRLINIAFLSFDRLMPWHQLSSEISTASQQPFGSLQSLTGKLVVPLRPSQGGCRQRCRSRTSIRMPCQRHGSGTSIIATTVVCKWCGLGTLQPRWWWWWWCMHAEVRIPDKMGCFCWVVKAKWRFFRSRPEKVLKSEGAQNKGLLDVGSAYISREVEVCVVYCMSLRL